MLSGPGALPVFSLFIAFLISVLVDLLVLMGSGWEAGGISAGCAGGGLLRSSNCSSCLVRVLPFVTVTGMSFFLLLPDSFLVVSYSSFMFFSVLLHSLPVLQDFLQNSAFSLLILLFSGLFTSLLAMMYRFCPSAFPALVRLLFRSSFLAFRICTFFSVSAAILPFFFCCFVFLLTVSSHVSIQAFLVLCNLFSGDWSSSSKSCSAWNQSVWKTHTELSTPLWLGPEVAWRCICYPFFLHPWELNLLSLSCSFPISRW